MSGMGGYGSGSRGALQGGTAGRPTVGLTSGSYRAIPAAPYGAPSSSGGWGSPAPSSRPSPMSSNYAGRSMPQQRPPGSAGSTSVPGGGGSTPGVTPFAAGGYKAPALNMPTAANINLNAKENPDWRRLLGDQQAHVQDIRDRSGQIMGEARLGMADATAGMGNQAVLNALQRGGNVEAAQQRADDVSARMQNQTAAQLLPQLLAQEGAGINAQQGTVAGLTGDMNTQVAQQLQAAGLTNQFNLGAAGIQSGHTLGLGGLYNQQQGITAQAQQNALMAQRSSPMRASYF